MIEKIITQLNDNFISLFSYNNKQNLVIVVAQSNFSDLAKIRKELKDKHFIIMSALDFEEGWDVFPMEFLHMQTDYSHIAGKDILKQVKIKKDALRTQLEAELRSKRIHLNDQFIKSQEKDFLQRIIPALIPVVIGLLFLKNEKPTIQLDENLSKLDKAYKIHSEFLLSPVKGNYLEHIESLNQWLTALITHIN